MNSSRQPRNTIHRASEASEVEESQYVDLKTVTNKALQESEYKESAQNSHAGEMANGAKDVVYTDQEANVRPRKPLERRESSRLQNAAKKLRRSLSSKVVSNKHNNAIPANDDYVDLRSLEKEANKTKTKEENKVNSEIEKNAHEDDGKSKRRSSASAFFASHHISNTSDLFRRNEKPVHDVKVANKTKEKRSHSFNGRSDSKKAAKLANLVRRESSSNVEKRQRLIHSSSQNSNDIVSVNPNGSSKSCEDLLDTTSNNNIYAEIPAGSSASSFSGAVRTPYFTISELFQKPEETIPGAKSILLTEDNLVPNLANHKGQNGESEYAVRGGPDLIQNLPQLNSARQMNSYVSKSYSVLRAEDNYSDYDYIDEFRSSNITTASATGFRQGMLNHNNVGKDHEEYYSSIVR